MRIVFPCLSCFFTTLTLGADAGGQGSPPFSDLLSATSEFPEWHKVNNSHPTRSAWEVVEILLGNTAPGPPSPGCDDADFLDDLRLGLMYYYDTGEMDVLLPERRTSSLASVDYYADHSIHVTDYKNALLCCLASVLMKLEQVAPLWPRSFYFSILEGHLHKILSDLQSPSTALTLADIDRWPVEASVLRLVTIEQQSTGEEKSDKVDLLLNFCRTRDWQGTNQTFHWLQSPSLQPLLPLLRVFVYIVDQPHCDPSALSTASSALSHLPLDELHLIKYRGGEGREEHSAYFLHLARHFHSLGEWVLFAHPDSQEHQDAQLSCLIRVLRLIATGSPFARTHLTWFPLSQQFIFRPLRALRPPWFEAWGRVFPLHPWKEEWQAELSFYEGGQQIVRSEVIRRQPQAFWQRLSDDSELTSGRYAGELEAMWHVLMGQPVDCTWRESDASLPLAMRVGLPVSFHEEVV